ncbi:M23 family metallopeptidase [[Clostridium] innocuum]|nr:M23 family metallopeptidase [[Clostridium] innocuum]
MTWVKYAAVFAQSKTGKKIITGVIVTVLSPFILLIVCICVILGGGAKNNAKVVDYVFSERAIPAEVSIDARGQIESMRHAFTSIEAEVNRHKYAGEEYKPDLLHMKAIFFSLFIGESGLSIDHTAFVNCFLNKEGTQAVLISKAYENLNSQMGITISDDVKMNVSQVYTYVMYGKEATKPATDGANGNSGKLPPPGSTDSIDIVTGEPVESYLEGFIKTSMKKSRPSKGIQSPLTKDWRSHVTSEFGGRIHPITGAQDFHTGLDIGYDMGTPVKAAMEGTVVWVQFDDYGYGYHVMLDHGGGLFTLYAHNSKILVMQGQHVAQGETISLVGMTGATTGPHLHFEVWEKGSRKNPRGYLP